MSDPSSQKDDDLGERTPSGTFQVMNRLLGRLSHSDPGTLATLRRADCARQPPPAFFRVMTDLLDDDDIPKEGPSRSEIERKWLTIVGAITTAGVDLLRPVRLGQALAAAGVAEMRVLKLLSAEHDLLADQVRTVVHHLSSKGQPFDPQELASIVLSDDKPVWRENVRRRVARDYYRHADA